MNDLINNQNNDLTTPGIGMGGIVMCPFGFQKSPCLKSGCEMWVELNYGKQKVARCALAWIPIVTVELRQEIVKLKGNDAEVSS